MLGVDPGPMSFRQLDWMIRGRREYDGSLAGYAAWILLSIHRDPKKKFNATPDDLNPFREQSQSKEPAREVGVAGFAQMLGLKKKKAIHGADASSGSSFV